MIEDAAEGCGRGTLGDMAPDALERYIGRKRAPDDDDERPWTPRTAHKCITAVRTHLHALVRE